MPLTASASVRAMTAKSPSPRASHAAFTFIAISAAGITLLAGEMAAALGEDLILELDRVGAGTLQHLDRAGRVDRVAEAGIGIDDQLQAHILAHRRHLLGEFGEGQEPDIGRAQETVGDARAGDIGGGKAQLLDEPRRHRIGRARHQQSPRPCGDACGVLCSRSLMVVLPLGPAAAARIGRIARAWMRRPSSSSVPVRSGSRSPASSAGAAFPASWSRRATARSISRRMDLVGVRTMEFCRRWGIVQWVEDAPYPRALSPGQRLCLGGDGLRVRAREIPRHGRPAGAAAEPAAARALPTGHVRSGPAALRRAASRRCGCAITPS